MFFHGKLAFLQANSRITTAVGSSWGVGLRLPPPHPGGAASLPARPDVHAGRGRQADGLGFGEQIENA